VPRRGRKKECIKRKKEVEQILVPSLTYCPRCSDLVSYVQKETRYCLDANGNVIAKHTYYYNVHYSYDPETKEMSYKRCYLGSDEYDYVERFNRLNLAGAIREDRYKNYLQRLIDHVDEDTLKNIISHVQQQLQKLQEQKTKDKLDTIIKKLSQFANADKS